MSILQNKYYIFLLFFFFIFNGCSNMDVGFEKNSIFHNTKQQQQKKVTSPVLNVYLDTSTNDKNKFRLIINGEDTEVNLYYNTITRFAVNQQNTQIELLKNSKQVSTISLKLAANKNYYLIVKNDKKSHLPVIQKTDNQKIDKTIKVTPIFVNEEMQEQTTITDTQKRKIVKTPIDKSKQKKYQEKRYEDGETIFYYNRDDGE